MIPFKVSALTWRPSALCLVSVCALALLPMGLQAQDPSPNSTPADEPVAAPAPAPTAPLAAPQPPLPSFSVRILDGRTGKPIVAQNVLLHVDHHDALSNDGVKLGDEHSITVTPPAGASVVALQGTYDNSMSIYINCDASADADTDKLYWYAIGDIMTKGVVAPNKGTTGIEGIRGIHKRVPVPEATAQPGEFVFFVRPRGRKDSPAY
jgi:hypothetical protein